MTSGRMVYFPVKAASENYSIEKDKDVFEILWKLISNFEISSCPKYKFIILLYSYFPASYCCNCNGPEPYSAWNLQRESQ